jgi:hypothetical protein
VDATPLRDLKLAEIDIFDPAVVRDPIVIYEAAREAHPWLARRQFGYFALEHA